MIERKEISRFRFGDGGELAIGVNQTIGRLTLNKFISEMETESDRSIVLVAASFFDEALSNRLRNALNRGNKKALDSLFDMNGPLCSFSSKIELLFCLGSISKSIRDDLHAIRKLRNVCAHHWSSFKLDEQIENNFLSKMKTRLRSSEYQSNSSILNTDNLHPRSRFIVTCGMLALILSLVVEDEIPNNS